MELPLLKDPQQFPTNDVLKKVLTNSFAVFDELIQTITGNEYSLDPQWNYYNDGKAWLCKVVLKKKTVFWLSIWEGFFKTTFYFTEKTAAGIFDLEIDNAHKDFLKNVKHIGKLIPLTLEMSGKDQINDLLKIIVYKKGLK